MMVGAVHPTRGGFWPRVESKGNFMNVLVLNAGSSSLKYQLMNTETREVFAKGNCEKIGLPMGIFGHKQDGKKVEKEVEIPD